MINILGIYFHFTFQDLSHVLPGLLENIFGFGAELGWGLDSITKAQQPVEFDSLVRLLAPEGQLLQLVYNLQIDSYVTYEFPFGSLPVSFTMVELTSSKFYHGRVNFYHTITTSNNPGKEVL